MKTHQNIIATIYDKRGRVLSIGKNSYRKTHPFQSKMAIKVGKPELIYLHAEIAALIKLKDWTKAYKIKIERYGKDGQPLLAKPCIICQEAINNSGIKIIEHT